MVKNNKSTLKKRVLDTTKEVLGQPTAPFREGFVQSYIKRFCAKRGIECKQDGVGNLIVTYGGEYEDSRLAFAAHMDHPGFIAAEDSKGKKLQALFYGGVEESYFKGSRVRFFGENGEVCGKVTKTEFDLKKRIKRVWLTVEGNVSKGDMGMWDLGAYAIKGDRLQSRACDDLVGCGAILALLAELKRRRIRKKVVGAFTVSEEAGLHGAKYLCMKKRLTKKTNIVAIETSSELCNAKMGDGVVVRVGDASSIFTPEMTQFMVNAAKKIKCDGFKYQRKLMDAGTCESSIYQAFGYCNGAVCVPLGNYHNRNFEKKKIAEEYVSVSDLENMVLLFIEMVRGSDKLEEIKKKALPKYKDTRRELGERMFF